MRKPEQVMKTQGPTLLRPQLEQTPCQGGGGSREEKMMENSRWDRRPRVESLSNMAFEDNKEKAEVSSFPTG